MRGDEVEAAALRWDGGRARDVAPSDGPALARLFEESSCPCYCRYLHFEGDKNDWLARCALAPSESRDELFAAVEAGGEQAHGVVAETLAGEIVGWAKLAPAASVSKAYAQRYYAGLACLRRDPTAVLLLACFLVHPAHRRRGVCEALVAAAVRRAHARGAVAVEALPREVAPPPRDEDLWTGPRAALERAGFASVGGDDAYPVLRLRLSAPGHA